MKGEITLRILEIFLEEFGPDVDALLARTVTSKGQLTKRGIEYRGGLVKKARERLLKKIKDKTKLVKLISKLRRQGLINEGNQVTKSGVSKLQTLKERIKKFIPVKIYKKSDLEKDHLKIIIFDVPEKLRTYRNWLRGSLIELGFEKIQKSVWMGEPKLPTDFVVQLKELNLLSYVKIFSVYKKGLLEEV